MGALKDRIFGNDHKIESNSVMDVQINKNQFLKRTFIFLLSSEITLILLDIFVSHHRGSSHGAIRRLVNITREDSIGTWFSSTQAILCGVVLFLIAFSVRSAKTNRNDFWGWMTLASFFTFIGLDDAVKFHERMGTVFKNTLNDSTSNVADSHAIFDLFPSYPWQILFGPFFLFMGFFTLWFLFKNLKTANSKVVLITALGLFAVAVGLDFLEGLDGAHRSFSNFSGFSLKNVRHYSKAIEEFFEMLGTTFFLMLFLNHLFDCVKNWKIAIR